MVPDALTIGNYILDVGNFKMHTITRQADAEQVEIEITPEMIEAAADALETRYEGSPCRYYDNAEDIIRAALSVQRPAHRLY